jgi:hypothetical protein
VALRPTVSQAQERPESVAEPAAEDGVVKASATPTRFLPGAIVPEAGAARVAAIGWGGYDGATQTPLMGMTAEARLTTRIVLGAGAVYAPAAYEHPAAVRPSVVVRMQLFEQGRHGFDGGVAVAYREDRFVGEEGFIQGTFAAGYHGERNTLLGNFSYGQDGEGDDFEGELRAAALRRFGDHVNLGFDGRFRKSLWSTDARGNPSLEYRVGPVVAYGIGPLALTAAAGLGGVRIGRLESGFVALGGVGATF